MLHVTCFLSSNSRLAFGDQGNDKSPSQEQFHVSLYHHHHVDVGMYSNMACHVLIYHRLLSYALIYTTSQYVDVDVVVIVCCLLLLSLLLVLLLLLSFRPC
jgi:hypothetical protein